MNWNEKQAQSQLYAEQLAQYNNERSKDNLERLSRDVGAIAGFFAMLPVGMISAFLPLPKSVKDPVLMGLCSESMKLGSDIGSRLPEIAVSETLSKVIDVTQNNG